MLFLNQVGIIPALLITLTGMLILHGEDKDKQARRFLLFLSGMAVFILLLLFMAMRSSTASNEQLFFQFSGFLPSTLLGILALILLHLKEVRGMTRRGRVTVFLLGLTLVFLMVSLWGSRLGLEYLVLPGTLVLALGWALTRRYSWLAVVLSLLVLGVLWGLNQQMNASPSNNPATALAILLGVALYVMPGLTAVLMAVLLATGLQAVKPPGEGVTRGRIPRTSLFLFVLALALLSYLTYTIFWGSLWDQTDDGLLGIFIAQPAGSVAIGVGMVMSLMLPGKQRLAGLLFMVVVPLFIYQSFEAGWRVSYHDITEKRAERITQALTHFQAREGYYPKTLEALRPRDLLLVPQPMILAGESWCYQGGTDFYRLGAFYREFFSSPVSLRVYAAAGEPPATPWTCEERLADMKEQYYSPMASPEAMRPPLPTPLPENELPIARTDIIPLLGGAVAAAGSWSPDSAYFIFGAETTANSLELYFLKGDTGDICPVEGQFSVVETLRQQSAWLSDGRLLYLDPAGEMVVLTPCKPEVERLTEQFAETFTEIGAYTPETGRLLLQSKDAYWILDGRSFALLPIAEVTPNPYEFHWDHFTWLPGGERLVISHLNGQDSSEGSTLYLISGETGSVITALPLDHASDQSAPWVEGLSEQELLLHGNRELILIDFRTTPPQINNIMADIFGLDIVYPDEVSAAGSLPDASGDGYYLFVRLNHPRNQATYLYHSVSGRVYVYDHEYHTLLLFPDGSLLELPKQELVPAYQDEYDLVVVDEPEVVQPQLLFAGHTPREYPHLSFAFLSASAQMAVASAQGVSLVSLPSGEMIRYWELTGDGFSPFLMVSPNGTALVAVKDYGGLYWLSSSPEK